MYGKIQRNASKIFNKLGRTPNSLENTFDTNNCYYNKQSCYILPVKRILLLLVVVFTFFTFISRVDAFSFNDTLENIRYLTVKSINDLFIDFTIINNNITNNYSSYINTNCIIYQGNSNCIVDIRSSNDSPIYLVDNSLLDSNYSDYSCFAVDNSTTDYAIYLFYNTDYGSTTNVSSSNRVVVSYGDFSIIYFKNSRIDKSYSINNFYTDNQNVKILTSNGLVDFVPSEPEQPVEPEEPTNENIDLSEITNLIYLLVFLNTFNILYNTIRNIFVRA